MASEAVESTGSKMMKAARKNGGKWKSLLDFKTLKAKILLGFAAVIVPIILMTVYNSYTQHQTNQLTEQMVGDDLNLMIADEVLAFNLSQMVAEARGYVLYGTPNYRGEFNRYSEESEPYKETVLSLTKVATGREIIERIEEWEVMMTENVFDVYDSGNVNDAMLFLRQAAEPRASELINELNAIAVQRETKMKADGKTLIGAGNSTLLSSIFISVAVVLIAVVVALVTTTSITKPIKLVTSRMLAIADGDLKSEPLEIQAKDETGVLAREMNAMQAQLRSIMNRIADASDRITGNSEELTQSANEVKTGSEQVATTMQELATGSETQAKSASSLSFVMGEFAKKVQEADESGEDIQKLSNKVLDLTNNGSELMESSSQQMQKIDGIVQDAVNKVDNLDNQTQEISKLVSIIQNVSDQTNLLALNASIEAARAGEHGRGFVVVADEVRKLAEQVAVSIADITGFVGTIQSESRNVSKALQAGYKEVAQGTVQIQSTGTTFNQISSSIQEMANSIQNVSENLGDIAVGSQGMKGTIDEIASVSEESAAGVEQTSAASQQITSSMEEVAGSSEELASLAEELNKVVQQFKL